MNDVLPADVGRWQDLERTAREVFALYGYREVRTPVVEHHALFARGVGEATDIVNKEMYVFEDKGEELLCLRPEGTAGVVRAFIEHGAHVEGPQKWFYLGPMFRRERPQKGRYRQFHQIGAEVIGLDDPKIDAQVLAMLSHFFAVAGIDGVALQLNSLGCPECRPAYRQALLDFLEARRDRLCADCQRRAASNPLRALDCKVPGCQESTVGAPAVIDHLCGGCAAHFAAVCGHLTDIQVPFTVNPRMVRGLDYYTKTTFEMVTDRLGAQSAVAAGGRYDRLVADLGGPPLPGIGFAMGVERLALLLGRQDDAAPRPELFIATLGSDAERYGFNLLTRLQCQGTFAEMDYAGKSLKAQLRRADKLGARRVLILGGDELARGVAQLRDMTAGTQEEITLAALDSCLGLG